MLASWSFEARCQTVRAFQSQGRPDLKYTLFHPLFYCKWKCFGKINITTCHDTKSWQLRPRTNQTSIFSHGIGHRPLILRVHISGYDKKLSGSELVLKLGKYNLR